MAVPPFHEFMPFIERISDGKEHHISELFEFLVQRFALSEQNQKELLPGRETRFKKRVYWTRDRLGQARLPDSAGRGRFRITEGWHQRLDTKPKPVDLIVLPQSPEFLKFRNGNNQEEPAAQPIQESESAQRPEELLETSHDLAYRLLD